MSLLPSSRLPSILDISSRSPKDLQDSLHFLRLVYHPEVRGSRRRVNDADRSQPSAHRDQSYTDSSSGTDLDSLRSDAFERSYAIKWLTAVISQVESQEEPIVTTTTTTLPAPSSPQREDILQEAASLLAIYAGTASAGTLTRVFTFTSSNPLCVIEVRLTDAPLENHDFSSVGAQTWGGACVLAERIVECPDRFGLIAPPSVSGPAQSLNSHEANNDTGFRVLELGAGTGLISLTLGKLLESPGNWKAEQTTIIATDFYPSVLANLQTNIESNFPNVCGNLHAQSSVSIRSHFLDWSKFSGPLLPPFEEPFDLILGADIVYEAYHAAWIKSCLVRLLRRPNYNSTTPYPKANTEPVFHLVIPLRPTHVSESNTVEEVFPRKEDILACRPQQRSLDLGILSQERVVCDAHGDDARRGNGNEVEYAYYRIGWC